MEQMPSDTDKRNNMLKGQLLIVHNPCSTSQPDEPYFSTVLFDLKS